MTQAFPQTLTEAFQANVAARPAAVAVRTPGDTISITWSEYDRRVRAIAAGLAKLGVGRGDKVAIMLVNRPEFHLVDTAALHLGATPFSIYNTFATEQVKHLLDDSGAKLVITEAQFVERLKAAGAQRLILVDAAEAAGHLTLAELEADPAEGFDFEASWRAVAPDDVATLIYTSGTTGQPKGVEVTHRSELAMCKSTGELLSVTAADRTISFLPSAHIADRWGCHYWSLTYGTEVTTLDDPKMLLATLIDTRPTIFGATPNVWQKLRNGIEMLVGGVPDAAAGPAIAAKIGLDAVRVGLAGAAPASPEVLGFFGNLGIDATETWGMSEVSGAALMNPPGANKLGTVGKPIPGVEIKLAEDGELLMRGEVVMRGYLNLPEKTAEDLDSDGWLHTGDVATIDEDGYVTIVDRKKEIIINTAGKNMSPAKIEGAVKDASSMVAQVAIIGDRRPYNVALIALDPDAVAAFANARGLSGEFEELTRSADIIAVIAAAVEKANESLARVEQIKKYTLLGQPWQPGGEELTPTAKLRRKPISAKYESEIEELYVDDRALEGQVS